MTNYKIACLYGILVPLGLKNGTRVNRKVMLSNVCLTVTIH